MFRGLALTITFLFTLQLTACAGFVGDATTQTTPIEQLSPITLESDVSLRIVATTTLLAEVLETVGGPWIELETLMPAGADPHAYAISGRDLTHVAGADLVFINGFGLEQSLLGPIMGAAEGPVVSLSQGIEPLAASSIEAHVLGGGPQVELAIGETKSTASDPHVWLDPANVMIWAANASAALSAGDPSHQSDYEARAADHQSTLEALDRWIESEVSKVQPERRLLVSEHSALTYFAERYGFEVIGAVVPSSSSLAEPSARELAALQDRMRRRGIPAIFVAVGGSGRTAELLAQDLGVRVVPLYLGSLGPEGSPASDYESMMRYNVSALVGALQDDSTVIDDFSLAARDG
jgi:ABC-type Zn uptake system ZnuABC Zn-binding protein ZnuA